MLGEQGVEAVADDEGVGVGGHAHARRDGEPGAGEHAQVGRVAADEGVLFRADLGEGEAERGGHDASPAMKFNGDEFNTG